MNVAAPEPSSRATVSTSTGLVNEWPSSTDDRIVVRSVTAPVFCDPLVGELLDATSPVPPDPASSARACRRYLLDIDGRDHVVLLASLSYEGSTRSIAIARYVRLGTTRIASPSLVVDRTMRRRGIGTRLLTDLVAVARKNGIERFRVEPHEAGPVVLHFVRHATLRPAIFWSGPAPVIEFALDDLSP